MACISSDQTVVGGVSCVGVMTASLSHVLSQKWLPPHFCYGTHAHLGWVRPDLPLYISQIGGNVSAIWQTVHLPEYFLFPFTYLFLLSTCLFSVALGTLYNLATSFRIAIFTSIYRVLHISHGPRTVVSSAIKTNKLFTYNTRYKIQETLFNVGWHNTETLLNRAIIRL